MAILTEDELRKAYLHTDLKTKKKLDIKKGTIITPSAKSFLSEKKIDLHYIDEISETKVVVEPVKKETTRAKFQTIYGGSVDEKPEHMTHLRGNLLVFKDHPQIAFRGKLDTLEAEILETQCSVAGEFKDLAEDLQEILTFVRNIVRSEVLNEQIESVHLLGMDEKELRERSHNPKKYYQMTHFMPDYTMGNAVIRLNKLRTMVRETELTAFTAFKEADYSVKRPDIIQALNRLSSLFWILMFRVRTGEYKK
ncbi:cobalamin adenosyltransferase [Listeria innocua]|uniref:cobalamin adenosyltransferase n=1 Tax=Listeria innocua TaxID=1642 RepID=UPI0010D1CD70|nr:cobalamin adenosyltransferase [Listeria innocua]EAD5705255.1 cobalamin adenosyltransferase [Listeria innocua]EAD5752054.1 cobalamin adenosyltransferase [Listeria innocua]EBB6229229.1 cobalamin adenosyltransferase [Listeria innocua]EFO6642049.1 cobalamin adenosyltransferase [Listeria innocua]EFV4187106.1 cobalamin adenosyltransferase [Listeria innocua]